MTLLGSVLPGQFFRHHRGSYYYIVCVSHNADNEEDTLISYRQVGAILREKSWHHKPEDFFAILPDGRRRFAPCTFAEVAHNLREFNVGLYEEINAWGVQTFVQRQP